MAAPLLPAAARRLPALLSSGALLLLAALLIHYWPLISFKLVRWQVLFHRELGALLREARDWSSASLGALLLTSFAYGVFHAAGPGHGKLVLATYLATQPSRLRQALQLSVAAALLQGLVAIALIGVAGWLFGLSGQQAQHTGQWLDRGSFLLIATLGALLSWRAIRQLRALRRRRRPFASITRILPANPAATGLLPRPGPRSTGQACGCGHAHVPDAEALNQADDWRARLGLLLAMGLRPCNGALLILVLARVMERFSLGVAATLCMAAGTALTVSLLALLSQRARHLAERWLHRRRPSHRGQRWAGPLLALGGGLLLLAMGLSLFLQPASVWLVR